MLDHSNKERKHTEEWKKNHSNRMSGKGNSMYGKVHPRKGTKGPLVKKVIDLNKIKELIDDGLNIAKITEKSGCSGYLIRRDLKNQEYIGKLKENNIHCLKGKNSFLKGKTYEEIFGKEKGIERSKKTSAWMKTEKNIRRFCKSPSKPQIELFKLIKINHENAMLEYPIKINDKQIIWLDIALVKEKINIEYDGVYWHKYNGTDRDIIRDKFLRSKGWKIIRIKSTDKDVITKLRRGGLNVI